MYQLTINFFILIISKENWDNVFQILNVVQMLFFNTQTFFSDFQAIDILNDDFGESEDNLSIRTLSERESSPVSFAVSPVGSVHENDNDFIADDVLLRGSPRLSDPSRFKFSILKKTDNLFNVIVSYV